MVVEGGTNNQTCNLPCFFNDPSVVPFTLGRLFLEPEDKDEKVIAEHYYNSTEGETKAIELTSTGRLSKFFMLIV